MVYTSLMVYINIINFIDRLNLILEICYAL